MKKDWQTASSQLPYWLTLSHCPGLGTRTISKLLKLFKTPQAICSLNKKTLRGLQLNASSIKSLSEPNHRLIESEIRW